MASSYGATPLDRNLRIRAGALLSFWQRRLHDERGTDADAETRRQVIATRMFRMRQLMEQPDAPTNEAAVRISEEWARFVEAPGAKPLSQGEKGRVGPKPGSPTAFLYGAFAEWLKHGSGVEASLYYDTDTVDVSVVSGATGPPSASARSWGVEEIPARARTAGRKAMQKLLEEMRVGEE